MGRPLGPSIYSYARWPLFCFSCFLNIMEAETLSRLITRDLLVEVLSRVGDGPALASAACACRGLRGAAKEAALWEELCHRAWPSTSTEPDAKQLVSSMPGGFARLYADCLPLLLYDCRRLPSQKRGGAGPAAAHGNVVDGAAAAASDLEHLVSFVDVYYKKKCVLSRVVHGVPPACDPAAGAGSTLQGCHFKLSTVSSGGVEPGAAPPPPPSIPLEPKEEGGVGVLNWMLEEDITLSWVLADVRSGRAVNLSGGNKPVGVQRNWPCDGDLVVRFGCPVPVDQHLVACGVAECVISVRCQFSETEEDGLLLRCTEIELLVEDGQGSTHLDGRRSLAVLRRALCGRARTRNLGAVEEGYQAYLKDRREMRERSCRKTRKDQGVLQLVCAFSGIALLLLGLCTVVF